MSGPSDPAEIGRYRIDGVIGRGAMGIIYRAHDPMIDRAVALKLVRTDLLEGADRADFIERFQREARAAARCAHPNIVAVYDFATHEGNPFIAMEFVEGWSVAQLLARARPSPDRTVFIVRQILDALAVAHAQGVVHRDIKPANILVAAGDRVKVTDFGISRMGGSELTQSGAMIGTPSYMSPEQCRGDPVDFRSDLFSTGALLYEMLTGERPFPGDNLNQITWRLVNEPAPPLALKAPGLRAGLQGVVDRALAKLPDGRFGSAADMAAALAAAAGAAPDPMARPAATVVTRRAASAPPPPPGTEPGGPDVARIERKLVEYVGPIGHYLVREAIGKAASLDDLCHTLSGSIERPDNRDKFLREVLSGSHGGTSLVAPPAARTAAGASTGWAVAGSGVASRAAASASLAASSAGGSSGAAGSTAISDAEIERAQRELTRHMGPIAKVMVKRALASATTPDQLLQTLAAHIERPADREAFLRSRGK